LQPNEPGGDAEARATFVRHVALVADAAFVPLGVARSGYWRAALVLGNFLGYALAGLRTEPA